MRGETGADQGAEVEMRSAMAKKQGTENNGDTKAKEREEKARAARGLEGLAGPVGDRTSSENARMQILARVTGQSLQHGAHGDPHRSPDQALLNGMHGSPRKEERRWCKL